MQRISIAFAVSINSGIGNCDDGIGSRIGKPSVQTEEIERDIELKR